MANLPYITAPGNIEKALLGIKAAATPERVTQDFVKTILKIPGGSGDQMTSFLRKIGFANADGTPTNIYKKFRNPVTSGAAVAEALKVGYGALYTRNEYMHELSDKDLKGLIIEDTGLSADASAVLLTLSVIKALKKFADFNSSNMNEEIESDKPLTIEQSPHNHAPIQQIQPSKKVGLNLSYTINLNLPATSDVAVFNAIFKSLKENLLKNGAEDD